MLYDLGCYFEQRFVAALQALHEPTGFLKVLFYVASIRRGATVQRRHIVLVDAKFRRDIRVQFDKPASVSLMDEDVGSDIFSLISANLGPGGWIKGSDQTDGGFKFGFCCSELFSELPWGGSGQLCEVSADNCSRQLTVGSVNGELSELDE